MIHKVKVHRLLQSAPPSDQSLLIRAGSDGTSMIQNTNTEVMLQVADVLSKFAVRLDNIEQKLNDRAPFPAPMNIAQPQRHMPIHAPISIPQVQRHCSLTRIYQT
jgi:hypothetical protein